MLSLILTAALLGQVDTLDKSGFTWEWHDAAWTQLDLMRGKQQVGSYDPKTGIYRHLLHAGKGLWSSACSPPVAVPPWVPALAGDKECKNFGLDRFKVPAWDRIVKDGHEITPSEFKDSLAKPADDKDLPWLVIIGSKERREQVLQAWTAANKDGADKLAVRVWSVPPDHWSLRDLTTGRPAFKTDGNPTIYLTAPDGRVLHRQDDFRGGSDIEAIRQCKKEYDAKKDTDWRSWLLSRFTPAINPALVVGGLGLGLLVLGKRKG